jgi:PAS domain S-box-containing protein
VIGKTVTEWQAQDAGIHGDAEATLRLPTPLSVLTALTQAPLGIAIFDRDMCYLAASSRYLTEQGLPGDTPLVGRLHYEVFPEVPPRWRDIHARALSAGMEFSHEADPFLRTDGRVDWIRWSVKPWRTDAGEIGGLVLYTEFVTPSVESRMTLEAAEARYRAVFDQVAMGVARVSPEGAFLEVNDRLCAITGYGRDELIGMTFQAITHPDDLEPDLTRANALLAGEIETFSMEKRYLTKGGGAVWANLTVSLVRTRAGEPAYFVSIVEDITSRKQVEAEQQRYQSQLRLLINELNHRVKNTLATVQSMAVQTMRSEPDQHVAYGKFEARLLSLSQVHDVLTRESWHGAALREVAERAVDPFSSLASRQVGIRGPDVWLQPGAALTMALVFHELATNAVKYGALSVDTGRVALSWSLDTDNARLRLTWVESGGPAVTPPTRKGFGSRLIERGLRGEFRGSAMMDYRPSGLSCTMEAQLPPPTEPPGLFTDL